MIFTLLLLCYFADPSVQIKVEENQSQLLIKSYFFWNDSLNTVPDSLSCFIIVEGKSDGTKSNLYKKEEIFFKPNEFVGKPICSMEVDLRDTLHIALTINKDSLVIAKKNLTWIRPRPKPEPAKVKDQTEENDQFSEIEIDGLIIDETRTKAGRDFYELFYTGWVAPENVRDYAVHIIEEPARGRSTIIHVKINDITVFKRYLQSRFEAIEDLSDMAIAATLNKLKKLDKIRAELLQQY